MWRLLLSQCIQFLELLHDHCSLRPFEKAKEYDIFISGYNSISVDWEINYL